MKENNEKLRILLKKVGREPEVQLIDNTLEAKKRLVNGLIEVVPFDVCDDTLIVCNEEGKILSLPPNTLFDLDYIAGDYFIVGDDYENGDFKSITDEQIEKIKPYIEERSFKYKDDAIERFDMERFKRQLMFLDCDDPERDPDFYEEWRQKLVKPIEDESEEHIIEDYENKNKYNKNLEEK